MEYQIGLEKCSCQIVDLQRGCGVLKRGEFDGNSKASLFERGKLGNRIGIGYEIGESGDVYRYGEVGGSAFPIVKDFYHRIGEKDAVCGKDEVGFSILKHDGVGSDDGGKFFVQGGFDDEMRGKWTTGREFF